MTATDFRAPLEQNGFTIIKNLYSDTEIQQIIDAIDKADSGNSTFRKSEGLFAIRQFLKEVPATIPLLFNDNLRSVIDSFGQGYFAVKSIYFDKPGESNWFVAFHQDLTISVAQKNDLPGFGPWTVKQGQFAVQPPLELLENIFTIRIHLDDATAANGALKVITGSHAKKIYRAETIGKDIENEAVCEVPRGGIMIMKPLLLHSSSRTTNNRRRRVIHIEFSNKALPEGLQWAEKIALNQAV